MFSSSSCDSENGDEHCTISARTLCRKRSYSVTKGCATITRIEKSKTRSKRDDGECNAIASVSELNNAIETSTSRECTHKHVDKLGKQTSSRRCSRTTSDLYNKADSFDSVTECSNAYDSTDSENDADTEYSGSIVLNYIRPQLDDSIYNITDASADTQHIYHSPISDGNKGFCEWVNEQHTSNYQNSDRVNRNGQYGNRSDWLDFPELSHERRPDVQQAIFFPHELDNISRVQSIEKFGPHSQSSSNKNKLSIDSMNATSNCEYTSDNNSQHESSETRAVRLQSTQADVELEACDVQNESHTLDGCKRIIVDSATSSSTVTAATLQAAGICEFVIISIETEDDDVKAAEYIDNNNSAINNQSTLPTKYRSTSDYNFIFTNCKYPILLNLRI